MLRPAFATPTDASADSVGEHLKRLLNKTTISRADIVEAYVGKNTPNMAVAFIYLASRTVEDTNTIGWSDRALTRYFNDGKAISDYIDHELADDHPTDRRFLLRHMELLCLRKGLSRLQSTGFGHDVIYSRVPIAEYYPKFDNTLYVPPLTGHWAIASKGAARD